MPYNPPTGRPEPTGGTDAGIRAGDAPRGKKAARHGIPNVEGVILRDKARIGALGQE